MSAFQNHEIEFERLDAMVQGWINHVRFANTWRLRKNILYYRRK